MRSLLVRAMFGERMVGRFVLQSGKRSSENRVQTTFWFSWEGLWFKKTACVCSTHPTHGFQVLRDLQVGCAER